MINFEETPDPFFFKKSILTLEEPFNFGAAQYTASQVITKIEPLLTRERVERIKKVIEERTFNFVPVMENIYDRGNVSAVMRSAEAFGFLQSHLIEPKDAKFKAANRVTKGADKWLDVRTSTSARATVEELKNKGFQIFATHLEASMPLSEVDFSKPTAVVLGNEKEGVSEEMVQLCDGRIIIPMVGFSQSFNISVAAALIFYHAYQDRLKKLGRSGDLSEHEALMVTANYYLRCLDNPDRFFKAVL